jgi:ribulose bisphosphate carboxylase small subunit
MDMQEYHELMSEVAKLRREHPNQYPTLIAFAERFIAVVKEDHRKRSVKKQDNMYGNPR